MIVMASGLLSIGLVDVHDWRRFIVSKLFSIYVLKFIPGQTVRTLAYLAVEYSHLECRLLLLYHDHIWIPSHSHARIQVSNKLSATAALSRSLPLTERIPKDCLNQYPHESRNGVVRFHSISQVTHLSLSYAISSIYPAHSTPKRQLPSRLKLD